MQAFEVLAPGLYTTVQDLGRPGYARFGVPDGGALDKFALQAANLLVGNDRGAAGLEVTQPGLALRMLAPTCIAVAGADLGFQINGVQSSTWCVHALNEADVLQFTERRVGVRAYVAFAGGIDVPVVLGSRSTYVRAGLGGFHGRPLQRGDVLAIRWTAPSVEGTVGKGTAGKGTAGAAFNPSPPRDGFCLPDGLRRFGMPLPVRVIAGPQADVFAPVALHRLVNAPFVVTPQSDRMGYRLHGPELPLATNAAGNHISDGIAAGSIQVPGDGQPIVLLADRQTTGGYPKIATVISADLDFLAQAWPGDVVRFRLVGVQEAHRVRSDRQRLLERVARFAQGI